MGDGCYLISIEQVISSLNLRRLKLNKKLGLEDAVDTDKSECCKGNLDDRDEDIEFLEACFDNASDLSEDEKATLYFISGYVTYKEDLAVTDEFINPDHDAREFTEMVSRGKLKYPPSPLYDLSLYI